MTVGIVMAAALAVAAPASESLTSYPAAFYAASQPATALDMVQRTPGFVLDTGLTSTGSVARGFVDAAGNVLIDGVRPPSKGDTLDQILQRIPASSVLRIDVIRAGAPGIDMQGKTVLANVVRRKDITGKLTVTASTTHAYDGRLSGTFRLEGEKRIGDIDLQGSLLAGRYLDDGSGVGIWTRTDGNGNPIVRAHDITQGHEINYKATGSLEAPLLGGTLKLNASVLLDPYHFQQQDVLIPPPGSDQEFQYNRNDTAEVGARYERPLTSRLKVETYLLQQFGRARATDDFTSDPLTAALTGDDESDHFKFRSRSRESIGRVVLRYAASSTLALSGGVEGDYNWLSTHTLFIENGEPVPLPAAQVVVTETRGEAFASAVWRARPTLTLEAGLRGEASHIASSGQVVGARSLYYPKPRLVVSWTPDSSDTVRLRLEREVSQLNFNDFAAQTAGINTGTVHAGNPALNPERDWVIEAAWDRRFWNGGDATITLRHYQYTDVEDRVGVIDPSSGIEFDAPGNIGAGTKDEAVFTLTLPTDKLGLKHGQLTGVVTLRRSHVTDPTTGEGREISGLHPYDWELHYSQGIPRWKATWGFDVAGNWRQNQYHFDEVDSFKLKTYIAPFVEYRPRADLTFKLELLNLTARGDETTRRIYAGPRNVFPLLFTDDRDVGVGRFVRVTFIKSFG